ncbi:hypothetical protein [Rhodanobacter sp. MP7CTX1]|uniref:hypothetical protein n=1 Tax=Rhodanobacter sp. MP7CTX1 TaxID=2723084 RepID=UPI001622E7B8|nr:hypothetical protein [Rhodanobacter sp. MP7CTX1]MBB6187806.1 asparagine synthetase B (glutamine-hydrolyzing) [Rhodanobacter sp. MP7CTX1]
MCSIFGIFDLLPGDDLAALRRQALELSQRQRHRGPDWSGVFVDAGVILVHERLAIVDPASGAQPLRSRDGELALAVNGEIYTRRHPVAAEGAVQRRCRLWLDRWAEGACGAGDQRS